jgi:hypothetical protein
MHRTAYEIDRWVHPPVSTFTTQFLRGHAIAVGSFSPVAFHPASRRVGYFEEIEVTIETMPGDGARRALDLLRTDGRTRGRLEMLVDNPEALSDYGAVIGRPGSTGGSSVRIGGRHGYQEAGDTYEYLIVTRDSLAASFAPLIDFHTRRGLRTILMTVEDIEATATGVDTPEKIRNTIRDEYLNHGIAYVLLGGDGDGPPGDPKIVPYRGFYCGVESSQLYEDDNIPADLYFSNLDGTFNDDADSLWAEPGEEDFYAEIAVGRACVDTPGEVANFIDKTITYQESPIPGQMRTALLLGEKLWNDPLTYGGDEMDQLVDTCMSYGFVTKGIPLDYSITKYYDRDMGGWSALAVMAAVSSGTNWLHHSGHCNLYYAMRLHYEDVTDSNFTNDGTTAIYTIVYTYGCYTGSFDNRSVTTYYGLDCIGEKMLELEHFAVAALCNSRYGWFTEGTTNGPSHHYQREFVDAVFTEGYHTLGAANGRSKDETVPFIDPPGEYESGAHRWCFYTLNLFGDPALDGWTESPETLDPLYPDEIARGDSIIEIEPGIPGAVVSLYRGGTCYGRGTADGLGRCSLILATAIPDTVGRVELNICAHNHYPFRDSIFVVENTGARNPLPPVTLEQNIPNPFNPSTFIRFTIPEAGHVELCVYNVAGQVVDRLVSRRLDAGGHSIPWTPSHLASGLYFYVLEAGGIRLVRKAVLIR